MHFLWVVHYEWGWIRFDIQYNYTNLECLINILCALRHWIGWITFIKPFSSLLSTPFHLFLPCSHSIFFSSLSRSLPFCKIPSRFSHVFIFIPCKFPTRHESERERETTPCGRLRCNSFIGSIWKISKSISNPVQFTQEFISINVVNRFYGTLNWAIKSHADW